MKKTELTFTHLGLVSRTSATTPAPTLGAPPFAASLKNPVATGKGSPNPKDKAN